MKKSASGLDKIGLKIPRPVTLIIKCASEKKEEISLLSLVHNLFRKLEINDFTKQECCENYRSDFSPY
jgi:hypothetical protein